MQRHKGAYGYFSGERFASAGNPSEITDEIALNPTHFATRSPAAVLSTLAHEMAHLWQYHFGKPSRTGYHNKEWAAKMREIGLIPSDTGEPGGKETGQRVTHYPEEGGAFACACRFVPGSRRRGRAGDPQAEGSEQDQVHLPRMRLERLGEAGRVADLRGVPADDATRAKRGRPGRLTVPPRIR